MKELFDDDDDDVQDLEDIKDSFRGQEEDSDSDELGDDDEFNVGEEDAVEQKPDEDDEPKEAIEQKKQISDISEVNAEIQRLAGILNDFSRLGEPGKRQQYLDSIASHLGSYYGYSEFMVDKFMKIFSISEVKYYFSHQSSIYFHKLLH